LQSLTANTPALDRVADIVLVRRYLAPETAGDVATAALDDYLAAAETADTAEGEGSGRLRLVG
jgi:hypothetical protein